ncbi:MAG: hypothetical protein MR492_06940 [Clostridiales bacterium]|nr:hypothetical protein [Clostridiales bacterium]
MGKVFPDAPDYCGSSYDFEVQEYSDRIVQYEGNIGFSHDGVLKGIQIDRCEGLQRESVRHSDFGECYPDYNYLSECIEELLLGIYAEE